MPQKSILVPYPASGEPGSDHDPLGVGQCQIFKSLKTALWLGVPTDCWRILSKPTLFRPMICTINRPDERGQDLNLNFRGNDCFGARRKSALMVALSLVSVLAVPRGAAVAQDATVSVGMIGIGSMSCAHWRSTKEHLTEGTVWIYGFWTGLNYVAAASEQAQSGTDTAVIVAEVKKACASEPSQTLATAVWNTFLGFNKK